MRHCIKAQKRSVFQSYVLMVSFTSELLGKAIEEILNVYIKSDVTKSTSTYWTSKINFDQQKNNNCWFWFDQVTTATGFLISIQKRKQKPLHDSVKVLSGFVKKPPETPSSKHSKARTGSSYLPVTISQAFNIWFVQKRWTLINWDL